MSFATHDHAITNLQWESFVDAISETWADGPSDWIDEVNWRIGNGTEKNDIYDTPERRAEIKTLEVELTSLQQEIELRKERTLIQKERKLQKKITRKRLALDLLLDIPPATCDIDPVIPLDEEDEDEDEDENKDNDVQAPIHDSHEVYLRETEKAESAIAMAIDSTPFARPTVPKPDSVITQEAEDAYTMAHAKARKAIEEANAQGRVDLDELDPGTQIRVVVRESLKKMRSESLEELLEHSQVGNVMAASTVVLDELLKETPDSDRCKFELFRLNRSSNRFASQFSKGVRQIADSATIINETHDIVTAANVFGLDKEAEMKASMEALEKKTHRQLGSSGMRIMRRILAEALKGKKAVLLDRWFSAARQEKAAMTQAARNAQRIRAQRQARSNQDSKYQSLRDVLLATHEKLCDAGQLHLCPELQAMVEADS